MPVSTDPENAPEFREDLAKLQVRLVDVLAGYDEIARHAEPEISGLIADWTRLHRSHEAALSDRLRALGAVPDEDGSFFSSVQRAIIKTRAAFDELDDDILGAVARGEGRVVNLYEEALGSARDQSDRALLSGQKAQVEEMIARTRQMAD
jgi:hypothetical protein